MRYGAIFACLVIAGLPAAVAQTDDADITATAPKDAGAEEAQRDEMAEPDPGGDVIKLKSGAELRGLQVIRETPTLYVVEIFEGIPPLEVPRRQVEEIIYDDFDPTRSRRLGGLTPEAEAPDELLGTNIDDELLKDKEFRDKLVADVSDPSIPFKGLPLPQVLKKLSQRADLPIVPSEAVTALPKKELVWTSDLKPGASLVSVLGEDFQKQFPKLTVVYTKKAIRVFTKKEHEAFKKMLEAQGNLAKPKS